MANQKNNGAACPRADIGGPRVRDGVMVLAPRGYHPTVSTPGARNHYFWALAAFSHASRRYDLAVNDPVYEYQKN